MNARLIITTLTLLLFATPTLGADLHISFEDFPADQSILKSPKWTGFDGFRGNGRPQAVVRTGVGIDGGNALAVWHTEKFQTDSWGMRYRLPQPFSNGVVWVQSRFHPPGEWLGGFVMDARTPDTRGILTRIAGGPYQLRGKDTGKYRWHSTWSRPFWRLYSVTESATGWQTITMRIDLDQKVSATWINDQPLGEEAPLSADGVFGVLHLGLGGKKDNPALIDNLMIGRSAPTGFSAPKLLPDPEDGLLFRFAAIGDPQLGFGGYQTDQIRYGMAAHQINNADAALTLVLGDMAHTNRDEQAYRDLVKLEKSFRKPVHYTRQSRGHRPVQEALSPRIKLLLRSPRISFRRHRRHRQTTGAGQETAGVDRIRIRGRQFLRRGDRPVCACVPLGEQRERPRHLQQDRPRPR